MAKKSSTQKLKLQSDFDIASAMAELEAISAKLQSSEVDLGEMMKQFERGNELATQIKTYLTNAENTIKTLQQNFEKGIDK